VKDASLKKLQLGIMMFLTTSFVTAVSSVVQRATPHLVRAGSNMIAEGFEATPLDDNVNVDQKMPHLPNSFTPETQILQFLSSRKQNSSLYPAVGSS